MQGAVIPNCAQDYTSTQDPDLGNNQACVDTLVTPVNPSRSVLRVVKHGPAVVHPGDTMTYAVDVTNPDPSKLPNFLSPSTRIHITKGAFSDNAAPVSTIVKHLKRVMAAEYSRDLSERVSRARLYLAKIQTSAHRTHGRLR